MGEMLPQADALVLADAHSEPLRVSTGLLLLLTLPLPLGAPEVEAERVPELERLLDTVPQVL